MSINNGRVYNNNYKTEILQGISDNNYENGVKYVNLQIDFLKIVMLGI